MAPNPKTAEIIDLTDSPAAQVIELSSDGEVVPNAAADTAQSQPEQTKRKRKKRKRKSTNGGASAGASEREEGEIGTGTSGADVSRNSPNVDDIELHIEMLADGDSGGGGGGGGEEVVPAEGSARKKTLAERLSGSTSERREDAREEKRERRERDRKRGREGGREREKDRERDRDRDRERRRDEDRDRRRRSRSRERERGGDRSRRRSRSQEREQRRREKAPEADAPLFFEDVTPVELPLAVKPQENITGPSKPRQSEASAGANPEKAEPDLLLPAHVSVAEGEEGDADSGALKVPTLEGSDDEDYIDYLDYDDDRRAPGMVRYWELEKLAASEAKATKPSRTVCKKCGAEGEHKTYECPVLICLTCGARDEHSTRSCPISKTCFTCGMKGHIGKTCPNRAATRAGEYNQYHDCDRCGARTHQTNECPTLWRIYEYVGDDERQEILRVRETKRTLGLGQGGEGYIATDEWCYNCGGCGHLGDDCNDRPKPFDVPSEPSAFSLYNILSGPFSSEATRPSTRAPRDWETAAAFADGFGFVAPMDVGKQGRKKERARLERRAREAAAEDDEDDWFGAARSRGRSGGGGGGGGSGNGNGNGGKDNRRARGGGGGGGDGGGGSKANGGGKIRFDFSQASLDRDRDRRESGGRDSKRQRVSYDDLPGPSRETDSIQIHGASRKQDRYGSSASRDRYDRDPPSRGPRYRGGYTR